MHSSKQKSKYDRWKTLSEALLSMWLKFIWTYLSIFYSQNNGSPFSKWEVQYWLHYLKIQKYADGFSAISVQVPNSPKEHKAFHLNVDLQYTRWKEGKFFTTIWLVVWGAKVWWERGRFQYSFYHCYILTLRLLQHFIAINTHTATSE